MFRRAISAVILAVLLTSTLTLAFNIHLGDGWFVESNNRGFDVDSLAERRWSFDRARGWSDFAYVDGDSAELVIGVSDARPDAYAELSRIVTVNGGKIVNDVSIRVSTRAVVADIPFDLVPSVVYEIKAAGLAKYVEPNFKFQAQFAPNDPDWSLQWGPQKIEAEWAWNATLGNSSILVAVIDSGIDYTHPDLAANYASGGRDWVNNDEDPMDDYNHGTKVAGIIAAVTNNEIGIAGLAQVKVMAEKIFDNEGVGYVDDVVSAIYHATDQGAKIISMSLSTEYNVSLLYDAVKCAYEKGVLLVAAAGNQASDAKRYPAAYDEVIAVTATNSSDNPADFTNFGDWVELAAPGVDIFTTDLLDENLPPDYQYYRWGSGTSFACPHVSGLAALVWSEFPNANRDWVRARLRETADDLGNPGFDNYYGYGRINARKAIYGTSPAINYTLAITTTAGGTTDPAPGNYTRSEGQNVPVRAIPDTGYGLGHWELDEVNVGSANPYSVLMNNSHTLQAVFVLSYTLTITTALGGATKPSPGSYLYNTGINVSVTATPDTYHIFDHWELDRVNIGPGNPYSVLMDNNHSLQAVFAPINYTFEVTTTIDGTTDPVPGSFNYAAGTIVNVTAIPDTNCYLQYWELDALNVGAVNPMSVTMDTNHTLRAVFSVGIHDVAVTDVRPFKTVIGQGYSPDINVTMGNQGNFAETFNVSVYANTTEIGAKTITLTSGGSVDITFFWNTTGFAYGNYTVSAYAWPVQGETNASDNYLTGGWVVVAMIGDLTGGTPNSWDFVPDGKVDTKDVSIVARCFGSYPDCLLPLIWLPNCDIDNNQKIDVADVATVARHFGNVTPPP
ncbi:S8 family serine peptidase [Candidatus Bathyarchaeota archaeon]|nr:S8 family serine peptidase [Candidatus Bathyarchaeota archaeon]